MFAIQLNKIGKKFGREWIFRHLDFELAASDKLVILGGNGSGKSTLLQLISGFILPNEGQLNYTLRGVNVVPEELNRHISFASPYLQLIEEFNLTELSRHCEVYKPFLKGIGAAEFMQIIELEHARHKSLKQFSSGMKQRVKLGLAILCDTPLLMLDEPLSNLDKNGVRWYRGMMEQYGSDRTVVVCSNAISEEFEFCKRQLNVMDFKP
ncbi:MAG TPA: ATP-binding cassette domain-containing protein [Bacteroidia bacterium]|nr:ATP-binding cassette domain-containing protein [Bacteroidia bacterium]